MYVHSRVKKAQLTRLLEPRTFYHKSQILDVHYKVWYLPAEYLVLLWSNFSCYVPLPLFWNGKFTLHVCILEEHNLFCFLILEDFTIECLETQK